MRQAYGGVRNFVVFFGLLKTMRYPGTSGGCSVLQIVPIV